MSIMVGVGRGAAAGVVVKNAEALERMEKVDTLLVDKTGTWTEGKPKVVAIATIRRHFRHRPVALCRSRRPPSQHPLAAAIVAEAAARSILIETAADFDAPSGKRVFGTLDGRRIAIGNPAYLSELGVDTAALTEVADPHRREGATAVLVAIDGKAAGVIGIADPVKATTPGALAALKAEGVRVIMVTGDNRVTAEAVARRLRLDEVEADVLPEAKSAIVARLQAEGRVVAMAGDGINDASALAAADVGIAMDRHRCTDRKCRDYLGQGLPDRRCSCPPSQPCHHA